MTERAMRRRAILLGSATARAMPATPVAVREPLRVGIAVTDDARCRVAIGAMAFMLPDEQPAMVAALDAMPDKARPVTIDVEGTPVSPHRYVRGVLALLRSAGFAMASVVAAPSGD